MACTNFDILSDISLEGIPYFHRGGLSRLEIVHEWHRESNSLRLTDEVV